jgi:ZIP family zinc transporter
MSSTGINTVSVLARNKNGLADVKKWLIANSVSPAVGVASAYFISVSKSTLGLILSVFIGLFLYISASDLIPESHHQHPTIWTTISTIIGMLVIFVAVQFIQ